MTPEKIIDYFGSTNTVYTFTGTAAQLQELHNANNISYNYIVVSDVVYFKADSAINNPNITVFHQGVV
jgi:hypothetical protein